MLGKLNFFPLLLSVFLMACSPPTTANAPTTTSQAQTLPITAQAIVPNGTKIKLEVAQTPQQQAIGLMNRTSLADDRGMLFKFPSAGPVRFWMKNTLIPLDMIFMHNGVVKYIQAGAPPCTSDPCPSYGPDTLIDTVLELRSGRAAELGLKVGDAVKIEVIESEALRR